METANFRWGRLCIYPKKQYCKNSLWHF